MKDLKSKKETILDEKNNFKEISTLSEVSAMEEKLKNVFQKIGKSAPRLEMPDFDIPKYGELFQSGSKFQYKVDNESDFEKAEEEMKTANIQEENLEFVS